MSRSEDLVIIRAEVAGLTDAERVALSISSDEPPHEEVAATIQRFRQQAHEFRHSPERIRSRKCGCSICRYGRKLDAVGLL